MSIEIAELIERWNTRIASIRRVDVVEAHFPSGLRLQYYELRQTGEVFKGRVTCDCDCGADFSGADEDEVRQLWAAHVTESIARQALTTVLHNQEKKA